MDIIEISFDVTKQEDTIINKIAKRATDIAISNGFEYPQVDAVMDVTACHANGCKLDLERLLKADKFTFMHDVFGIRRHINRKTGKLGDFFIPRYAVRSKGQWTSTSQHS